MPIIKERLSKGIEMDHLSFQLPTSFVNEYKDVKPVWGFDIGAGNSLSELTYITKYSMKKADGSKERWYETCERVINGTYSILKDHAKMNGTYWNENKALHSAKEAYTLMFEFKWTPPGRGLQNMGKEMVNLDRNSAPLINCSFISTEKLSPFSAYLATRPFVLLMEQSMNGIGVGFDTRGSGKLTIFTPKEETTVFVIEDNRESWAESVGHLLESYFLPHKKTVEFDYSLIRPAGSPLGRFGGTASGPEPLCRLHEKIRDLLDGREGEKITSTDIVDVCNLIGKAVVSGGARRSAEIALGFADDKEFLNLKNWEINPERNGADGWAHLSNNSVVLESGNYGLENILDRVADNGEPGIINLGLARSYGRLKDGVDDSDSEILGVNPCQPAWATVLTPNGISTIGEISIGDFIWSETGWTKVVNKWSTGVKEINRYSTTSGSFFGTENHRLVSNGVKVEARDCQSVDTLTGSYDGVVVHDPDIIMDGLVIGDGTVHKASNNLVLLLIGDNDYDYLDSEISTLIVKQRDGIDTYTWEIKTSVTPDELPLTFNREIPARFFNGDTKTVASFLRGLYSANGSVVNGRVTFKTASPVMRDQVQVLLSSIGIRSYYTTNKKKNVVFSNGEYECKESYDVNITVDRGKFYELIGFIQQYKMDKLKSTLDSIGSGKITYDITSVEYVSTEEVFDITVDNHTHTYWTSGVNVSNCAEVTLESYEVCNLSEVHMPHVANMEEFKRVMKFAYLYSKAVTLLPTPWAEVNNVVVRNRRIGTSVSGVTQFLESHDWSVLTEWLDLGYVEIISWDKKYSSWLGVRESIKHTSVKPSGTVSIISGITPGIHWPVASGNYVRRQRFTVSDPMVALFAEAGYHVEPDVMDPDFTVVVEFPTAGPVMRDQTNVSLWEKAALAALLARYWADNAVSVTLTFDPDSETSQVGPVVKAYFDQLKTMSFLKIDNNVYPQMPYESVEAEKFDTMRSVVKPIDWSLVYDGELGSHAQGDKFCDGDTCLVPIG